MLTHKKRCEDYSPSEWANFIEEYADSRSLPEVKNRTGLPVKQIRKMCQFANRQMCELGHPSLPLKELSGPKRRSTPIDYSEFERVYRTCATIQDVRRHFDISASEVRRRVQVLDSRGINVPCLPDSPPEDFTASERSFRRLRHSANPTDISKKLSGSRYRDLDPNAGPQISYLELMNVKFKLMNRDKQT